MKMIQISKLPFEIQNAIFELGTSMLLYAINMNERDAEACCYQDRRSFGHPQDKFLSSDEVVTEIANSCPLAYTCRRSRAAVYKTLHRLMQASFESSNRAPNAGISILKYIQVTVRIGNLVAKEAMKRESESPSEKQCRNPEGKHGGDAMYCNCPRCEGSIETGLDRIVGLRSRWLYDNPLITVTVVRSRCAEIPHYLMEYVNRIDTEWWFNRHKNACVASDVLRTSFGMMFHQARHLTITPCMPLMSAAQPGNKLDIVKGRYWLRNSWTDPEEIAMARLRQWKTYDGIVQELCEDEIVWVRFARFFYSYHLEMYVTESFPLPIFEIVTTEKQAG
ncbi:hypothetical protein GCG54_00010033 [Colletotrichum gloeosporioides]|uniref:Uncharacterized protein n=1 Tax=Colletotrichum gloeosporioides TaxID=474922 RepID=A0A8H4C9G5_COLGL|nr:uncharacterized protein GCG54_00010033 [Colletotrichum gloeosporioides]KAF3799841.1 hypothetical protein GCG54_00010033 [Colletotrichum gloeosporioides]